MMTTGTSSSLLSLVQLGSMMAVVVLVVPFYSSSCQAAATTTTNKNVHEYRSHPYDDKIGDDHEASVHPLLRTTTTTTTKTAALMSSATTITSSSSSNLKHRQQHFSLEGMGRRFLSSTTTTSNDNTCIIGDGYQQYTFQHGESLGNLFETRCSNPDGSSGSTSSTNNIEFPCYCNVNKYPVSIECPYCAFTTNEIETYQDDGLPVNKVVCAKHDQTIQFTNKDNIYQSCSCHIPKDSISPPITQCETIASPNQCTIELSDGTVKFLERGESYGDYLPTRCTTPTRIIVNNGGGGGGGNDDFPCYCDPDLPNKINCPYCPLLDYATVVVDDDLTGTIVTTTDPQLVCARHDEIIEIVDETLQDKYHCSCSIPDNDDHDDGTTYPKEATTNCIKVTPEPSVSPTTNPTRTASPTITSTIGGGNGGINPPTATPSESLLNRPTDRPIPRVTSSPTAVVVAPPSPISILPPVFDINDRGCFINNVQHPDGGSTLEFVKAGNSFGDLVTGPCGSSEDWPTYCNPDLPGGTTQEYPYCIFVAAALSSSSSAAGLSSTTASASSSAATAIRGSDETIGTNPLDNDGGGGGGDNVRIGSGRDIVCARDGEEVTFTSALTGKEQTCSCFYFSSTLGALSSCQQDDNIAGDGAGSSPTSTTSPPVSTPSSGDPDRDPSSGSDFTSVLLMPTTRYGYFTSRLTAVVSLTTVLTVLLGLL